MHEELIRLGLIDENEIALDAAALSLALLDHPDADLAPYNDLLAAMATRLKSVGHDADEPGDQADALAAVLAAEGPPRA